MELDRVDTLPLRVERVQYGRVAIGETRVRKVFGRPEDLTGACQFTRGSSCSFAAYRLLQGRVRIKQIVIFEGRGLIEYRMRIGIVFHGRLAPNRPLLRHVRDQC